MIASARSPNIPVVSKLATISTFCLLKGEMEVNLHVLPTASIVCGFPVSYASCELHIKASALPIVKLVAPGSKLENAVALYSVGGSSTKVLM
jgi:hypothetical protein